VDDETHLQRYADAIHAARDAGDDAFQNWFNKSGTADESLRRGYWDFAFHVLTKHVVDRMADLGSLTALEIGYGGWEAPERSRLLLRRRDRRRRPRRGDRGGRSWRSRGGGTSSFSTRTGAPCRFPKRASTRSSSCSTCRRSPCSSRTCRKRTACCASAVAQLYSGRLTGKSRLRGYREITDAQVNHVSLALSPRYAARLCRRAGLSVVGRGVSYNNVPDGYPKACGGQGYVTVVNDR
jgi:hypothetical protein